MVVRRRAAPILALLAAVTTAACTPPEPELSGEQVDVVGLWSGPEYDAFATVAAAWEDDTAAVVDWHGSQDIARDLATRLAADDPPDLAVLPNPGLLHDLVDEGALVPLDLDPFDQDYSPAWLDLGSDGGELYGVFAKVSSKATVWYSPPTFAADGDDVPATWDDLTVLADRMVADGRTPFSVVAPTGPGSGWALTDWVSQLVLGACGPQVYDRWVAAEIPWTDDCVRGAFDRFVALIGTPGYVLGGTEGILTTSDADGVLPLYTDPPSAAMYPMASFAQGFITSAYPDLVPGDDYGWFRFPAVDPEHAAAITVGGDVVVLMTDTPAARSFLTFLAGADAQAAWVELGGYTSANRSVPSDAYADPVARSIADQLTHAEVTRFGAGDLMPAELQRAWWAGMLDLVEDPATLDALLASLTRIAANAR
ncbi:carbohydrate ABC transporter substrate-binding protein [Cellulomonas humilata]|uniref:Carbohydrate ABC transporter substrate-binding protein n=1 Tax=Cellulomonas humilata TaxID=144055 RepID=A0A7Y6DZK2_9CELL|nr:ABC transporter substrate-binding protein [Cellulomonas humilata]NUU19570.1 carbohydrate ABC transporter substrate-binding protein [Cellulomonas humilata]